MVELDIEVNDYLGQTTVDAAAAGLHLIDIILAFANDVTFTLHNGRIQFQARHPFCTIQPHPAYLACDVKTNGRSQTTQLASLDDVNATLHRQLWEAYQRIGK